MGRMKKKKKLHPEERRIAAEVAAMPRETAEDPRKVVIAARARFMGVDPSDDMLAAMLCEPAGRAIHLGAKDSDEAKRLWSIFTRIDGADETYHRLIIGKPRFPAVSRLEMMPERFETRADDRPDLRTEDEKVRDTKIAWSRWQALLWRLGQYHTYTIQNAMRHSGPVMVLGGKLTTAGQAFVAALRSLRREDEK